MGRKSLFGRPMTSAERSARSYAKIKANDPGRYQEILDAAKDRKEEAEKTLTPEQLAHKRQLSAERSRRYREKKRAQAIPEVPQQCADSDEESEPEEVVDLTAPPQPQPGWVKRGRRTPGSTKNVLNCVIAVSIFLPNTKCLSFAVVILLLINWVYVW